MNIVKNMVFYHNIWQMKENLDSMTKTEKNLTLLIKKQKSFIKIFKREAFQNLKKSSRIGVGEKLMNTRDLPKACRRVKMAVRTPTPTKCKLEVIMDLEIGNWDKMEINNKKRRKTKFKIKILVQAKINSS